MFLYTYKNINIYMYSKNFSDLYFSFHFRFEKNSLFLSSSFLIIPIYLYTNTLVF